LLGDFSAEVETSSDGKNAQWDRSRLDRWKLAFKPSCYPSCIGVDCDADRCLMVSDVRETLSVSKRAVQECGIEWFDLDKLNDMKVWEEYQVKISYSFAALENFDDDDDDVNISRAWESIRI
jgi:hypothetical protein